MSTIIDLTNQRFGNLLVVRRAQRPPKSDGCVQWICQCNCGNETTVSSNKLRMDHTTSCGCLKGGRSRFYQDETGNKFGRLTVLRPTRGGGGTFLCVCECGEQTKVPGYLLRRGNTRSCGCLKTDLMRERQQLEYPTKAAENGLLRDYQRRASLRNYEWRLTREEFFKLAFSNCDYCGSVPKQIKKIGPSVIKYNGIDRQDNRLGYVLSNCVACCGPCNKAKGIMTHDEFLEWVIGLVQNYFPPPAADPYNLEAAYREQWPFVTT